MATLNDYLPKAQADIQALKQSIQSVVLGQSLVIDKLIVCLLAGGHVLLEGVPGLGKTLMVKALAASLSCQFGRIQFTPDVMPSDVVGHTMYDMKTGEWQTRFGAVFCQILLADELNRASPKTQSALLEVMQERQATIEGKTHPLPAPFLCIATQNPWEQEGTYPLPEAQLDRFLMNIVMDYPSYDQEKQMLIAQTQGKVDEPSNLALISTMSAERLLTLQRLASYVQIEERVLDYILDIVRQSRNFAGIQEGAGSRAALALVRGAKALALKEGRAYVVPDDVAFLVKDVLRHRVHLSQDMLVDNLSKETVLDNLLSSIAAPRS